MQSFNFKCPTEIVFGRGAEKQVAEKIRAYGGSRVFIVYGGGSVMRTGLLPRIESYLTGAGLAFQVLGGVKPNPRLSLAREGVRLAKQFGANFILAVGGGSVIDTTKAIAHGVANPDTDIWDFWTGRAALTKTTPFGSVLTLAAAGSETSDSAVLTNEETGKKQGLNSPLNRAALAFMNPELTYTAPLRQIKAGICDIMMHTLERYFTKVKEPNLFTDLVAESLLKTMMKEARAAVKDTHDYEAMSEIMWCGSVSHSNFTELGRCKDFSCHRLGHELSGRFDVTHGESLTTLWGHWAKYVYQDDVPRFAHFAEAVFGIADGTEERALAGIDAMVAFFRELGMPTNFTELGIGVQPKDVIAELADMLTFGDTKTIGNFHPMDKQTAIEIYERANH